MYWRINEVNIPSGYIVTTTSSGTFQYYDPEKYDLVEKKDYKASKIKASLDASNRQKENNYALLNQLEDKKAELLNNIKECEEDIKRLQKELKELES